MNWIRLDEKMPPKENDRRKLSIDVLAFLEDGEMIVTYFNYVSGMWELNNSRAIVTHWMELPNAPI